MKRRRETKAERDAKKTLAERRVWETFRPQLAALQSFVGAKLLVSDAPREDRPGRSFYSNLGFFLQAFIVPMGSSYEEKALYLEFIRRLDTSGALKPGVGQRVEEDLHQAMERENPLHKRDQ